MFLFGGPAALQCCIRILSTRLPQFLDFVFHFSSPTVLVRVLPKITKTEKEEAPAKDAAPSEDEAPTEESPAEEAPAEGEAPAEEKPAEGKAPTERDAAGF